MPPDSTGSTASTCPTGSPPATARWPTATWPRSARWAFAPRPACTPTSPRTAPSRSSRATTLADTVVDLGFDDFAGLVSDLDTAPGLFYGNRVTVSKGKPLRFVRWEPGLRALFHGRPIFDPETVDLRDRHGEPLDPTRRFPFESLTDPDVAADATHFLVTTGYVVVSGVFDRDDVGSFLEAAGRLEAGATPGDGRSWWGRTSDGTEILNRVLNAADRARSGRPARRSPGPSGRCGRPGDLVSRTMDGVHPVTVLWKRPDAAEGLGDLPWHRDCGMGGHALNCPTTVMTICLTDGSPGAGALKALPGSHAGSFPFVDGRDTRAPEGVTMSVTAGDVSLHYSDVMHASMPPTSVEGPHRISALLAFVPPVAGHHRGERHYNDVLLGGEGGQVEHLAHRLT